VSAVGESGAAAGAAFGVPEGVRRVFPSQPGATRIVLVRHGEAVCNVDGVVGGVRGCTGLTELGRAQVLAVRRRLERTGELRGAQALYSSTLPRAVETAALLRPALGDGTLDIIERDDLCELYPGQADALTWQEVIDDFGVPEWDTDPGRVIAPDGESWTGFVARATDGVRALALGNPGGLVVAAVHAGVIEATMIAFLQIPPEAHRRGWSRVAHASLTEWEWVPGDDGWVLMRFNDACDVPWAVPLASAMPAEAAEATEAVN
jgi:2,3-bisphosphoglycerate-dependent phosphoglycerate mutase